MSVVDKQFADEFGAEIADALAPYAPDATEFDAGVRDAIDRREARARALPPFVRRAAALLPPMLVPAALAKTGVAATGIVAKKAAWKAATGLALLPAAIVVMLVVTFFYSLHGATVRGAQADGRRKARAEVRAWWRRNAKHVVVAFAALVAIGIFAPAGVVLLFFGVSMLVLVGVIGALARAGFATRREVGDQCAAFLLVLVPYAFMISSLSELGGLLLGGSGFEGHASSSVMFVTALGAAVCAVVGHGVRSTRSLQALGLVVFAVLYGVVDLTLLGRHRADRAYAVRTVEEWRDFGSPARWGDLAGTIVHLRAAGVDALDVSTPIASFRRHAEAVRAAGAEINPLQVRELEAVGFFRAEDYRMFEHAYWVRYEVDGERPLTYAAFDAFRLIVHGHLQGYSDDERARLAARVVAGVEEPTEYRALADLVLRTRMLEYLGYPDRCDELRDAVAAALRATWTGWPGAYEACFAPGYDSVERDGRGVPEPDRLTFVWLDSTDFGVRLLARYGVPDGIDLRALDRYLRRQSLYYGLWQGADERAALAAAMREHLRVLPGWSAELEVGLLDRARELQLVLGGLLLSVLCVAVTLRTPVSARAR